MQTTRIFCLAAIVATSTAFAAAPAGPTAGTPAVAPVTGAPKPTIPVFEGRDPDKIADGDTVITQVIPIKYLAAADIRDMLSTVVHPDSPIVASGNSIVVTEASGVVKRIVQIICYVDVKPEGDNVMVVIPISPGNAAEAARQINAVFNPK